MRTPSIEQFAVQPPAGQPDEPLVGVRPGHDDANAHAPPRGARRASAATRRSGRKYGVLMSMSRHRAFDQHLEHHARDGRAVGRRALDQHRLGRARRCEAGQSRGEVRISPQHSSQFSAKTPCSGGDDRAFDARHRVAPRRLSVERSEPPVGDAGAAGEGDPAVDDEQLAVRPVVQAVQAVPA